jgi:hypothetical protein
MLKYLMKQLIQDLKNGNTLSEEVFTLKGN